MKRVASLVLLFLASHCAFGQPAEYERLLNEGRSKRLDRDWKAAADLFEAALRISPHDSAIWSGLGDLRSRAEQWDQAIEALLNARSIGGVGGGYKANLGFQIARCHALAGRPERALEWIATCLDDGLRDIDRVRGEEAFAPLRSNERFRELAFTHDVSAMSRDEAWRYDLKFMVREIERIHFDPFKKPGKARWDEVVADLDARIPSLSDYEVAVGLMRLAALPGDGHTSVTRSSLTPVFSRAAGGPAGFSATVPVQFALFEEGWFVTAADSRHSELVGAQVLEVAGRPIAAVFQALLGVISRDNDQWPKLVAAGILASPPILHGLGLVPEPGALPLRVRLANAVEREMTVPCAATNSSAWTVARDLDKPEALTYKNRSEPYWYEFLEDSKTVFFQYNSVRNAPGEALRGFCSRLFRFIEENDVERLVIDMRWNSGGNNFLNQPLVHGLIRCDKVNRPGKLFVIVGRNTYSAAMNGATDIERETEAIFVGEPTGSSPNFVGETNPTVLPASKIRLTISDLYWQRSIAFDYRPWIAPSIPAPPTFATYKDNRDPALEAILARAGSR